LTFGHADAMHWTELEPPQRWAASALRPEGKIKAKEIVRFLRAI